MELLHTTVNWLSLNWQTVGAYAGFGAGLSVLFQFIKKQLKLDAKCFKKIDQKTVIRLLFTFLTALPFIVDQILQLFNMAPELHASYGWLFVAATTAHWFVLSPAYKALTEKAQEKQAVKDKAAAYDQLVSTQSRAAVEPTATRPASSAHADGYDPTQIIQG